MEASDDPLKDIKVALIRQQMATQFPNGNPASSGSGSGGSSRRSSGYSSSGSSGNSGNSGNNSNSNSNSTTNNRTTPLNYYRSSSANRIGARARTANTALANATRQLFT